MTRSSAVVADHAGLENDTMNISHKLITLGLAFSLLGSTCAFARPMRHFENGGKGRSRVIFRQQMHSARPTIRVLRLLMRIKMAGRPICS